MVLREVFEVFEVSVVVDLDGCLVGLVDNVFCDIGKVLRFNKHLVKFLIVAVYSID